MKLKNSVDTSDIFQNDNNQIELLEDVVDFFSDSFIENLDVIGTSTNDIVIFKMKVSRVDFDTYLNTTVDDSTTRVIINAMQSKSFKEVMIEKLEDFIIKSSYEVSISSMSYEYDAMEIRLIVACSR